MSGLKIILTLSCILTELLCICYLTRNVISLQGWKRVVFYFSLVFFESPEIVSAYFLADLRSLQIFSFLLVSVIVYVLPEKNRFWQTVCLWNNVYILKILCRILIFIYLLMVCGVDTSLVTEHLIRVSEKTLAFRLICYLPSMGVAAYLWRQLMRCSGKVKKSAVYTLFLLFFTTCFLDEWQQILIGIPGFLIVFTLVSFSRMMDNKLHMNKLAYYKMMEEQIAEADQEIEAMKQQVETYYNHIQGGEQYMKQLLDKIEEIEKMNG